jgi:RNA polymerase sigma factor (sigma-70 family)
MENRIFNNGGKAGNGHLPRQRKAAQEHVADAMTDRELLQRFAAGREESAFATLVQRHGPLVYGVCRKFLRDAQEAEDAFQATFLVLACKAKSIRKVESVASWLYGVASRLSNKMRFRALRRRNREQKAATAGVTASADDLSWRETCLVLHEELNRLPDKYRAPLLLCYWEGQTQDEAARHLGWPRGTLKRRLEAGRERLHSRLARRGIMLSAVLLALSMSQRQAWASVGPKILKSTLVLARASTVAGRGAWLSTGAALLASQLLRGLATVKLRTALVGIVTAGAIAVLAVESPGVDLLPASPEMRSPSTLPPGAPGSALAPELGTPKQAEASIPGDIKVESLPTPKSGPRSVM